jgi:hypothetical protein
MGQGQTYVATQNETSQVLLILKTSQENGEMENEQNCNHHYNNIVLH